MSENRWETIKRGQPIPPCYVAAPDADRCTHVERVVAGGLKVGRCERRALPRLVVCEHHATPDAVRMLALAMAAEIDRLKSGG